MIELKLDMDMNIDMDLDFLLHKCEYMANPDTIKNEHGNKILNIYEDFFLVPVKQRFYKKVTCDGILTYRHKDQ